MKQGDINPKSRFAPPRVGLLGGSFNPAHQGHADITLAALQRLKLDQVWWLVSPQNPLKTPLGMAPFQARLKGAACQLRHPRLRVTGVERALGTRYTADTLKRLARAFPRTRFVWLMGADNLLQISRWEDWQQIFRIVSIAVFARPTYCFPALSGKAARRFAHRRLAASAAGLLARSKPPAWAFLFTKLNPISASAIRAGRATGKPRRRVG
jgi:nicotinate-nucleotide adenylyltransferase